MGLFAARAPIDDRRMFRREQLLESGRVCWLDPEGAVAGWWLDFSAGGARMAMAGPRAPEPGSLLRGWAQDPRPGAPREFLALDLRVCWSASGDGAARLAQAGCRFERVGRLERAALEELFKGLSESP